MTSRRPDNWLSLRVRLANLSDKELAARFWKLAGNLADPLVILAAGHTSPSIERSVLMRMGFTSLEAQGLVDGLAGEGLLGKGAGHAVLRYALARGLDPLEAGRALLNTGAYGSLREQFRHPLEMVKLPGDPHWKRGGADGGWYDGQSASGSLHRGKGSGGVNNQGLAAHPGPIAGTGYGSGNGIGSISPDESLPINALLSGLAAYRPRRRGWVWRERTGTATFGPFTYSQVSRPLSRSVPLPAARHNFGGIDPQPEVTISAEIASGRFEEDLRRFRMAAWHGSDHIMVIRTAGQSHMDGILEGSPEGIGGVPITRKQLRASRRALDLIEDEVGRPINLHSYVSGVAGPEMAVLFAEEGVAGAHQDPQYNVLYRGINMVRSFVDAAVAKGILAAAGILQIDGAHNANATAREAWKVTPELLVQHAINCAYSVRCGMCPDLIALSTVPPTAPPAPAVAMDLPYALALRRLFRGFRFRAQMNTRYMETSTREATVAHVLNLLISRLLGADIQSTITPDEGRHIPWHRYTVEALDTARQTLSGLDGLADLVRLREDGPLGARARELVERAVLFLEEILALGGYFKAAAKGYFVDSGFFPERNGDGIRREIEGGVAAGTVVPRDPDYLAPVCHHVGRNALPPAIERPCDLIGGCTLCRPEKIPYIDELDEEDNAGNRLAVSSAEREKRLLRPEAEWWGDGLLSVNMVMPAGEREAKAAALAMARKLGLEDPRVADSLSLHPVEGTMVELEARLPFAVDPRELEIPPEPVLMEDGEIRRLVAARPLAVVAATVGQDEHSVGLREIIDLKHGGLEAYGIRCHYLGTSVPVEKLVDAAAETGAEAILISTIISHGGVHTAAMRRLDGAAREKGLRPRVLLVAGGPSVTGRVAMEAGMDAGFGRGTTGREVATFLVASRTAVDGAGLEITRAKTEGRERRGGQVWAAGQVWAKGPERAGERVEGLVGEEAVPTGTGPAHLSRPHPGPAGSGPADL